MCTHSALGLLQRSRTWVRGRPSQKLRSTASPSHPTSQLRLAKENDGADSVTRFIFNAWKLAARGFQSYDHLLSMLLGLATRSHQWAQCISVIHYLFILQMSNSISLRGSTDIVKEFFCVPSFWVARVLTSRLCGEQSALPTRDLSTRWVWACPAVWSTCPHLQGETREAVHQQRFKPEFRYALILFWFSHCRMVALEWHQKDCCGFREHRER